MKKLYIIVIVVLSTTSLLAQNNLVFYSNIENSTPVVNEIKRCNGNKISLGDNSFDIIDVISSKGIEILGDKDVDEVHTKGRISLDRIKKKSICPGPIVKEIDDQHVLITINSNWIIDEDYRYYTANEDCDVFNHTHMIDALTSLMEDYDDWNKIIVTHHPTRSISELDGQGLTLMNLVPVYGQLRRSFKANSGNIQDMPSPTYNGYIRVMDEVLSHFDKVVFVSGHDRLNTVIQENYVTYININSGDIKYRYKANKNTLYLGEGAKYLEFNNGQFSIIGNGEINYTVINPFLTREPQESKSQELLKENVSNTTRASEKYHSSGWNKFWMGSGYRDVWSATVKAPLLNIDEYDGGLKPYAIGGGLQTMSVKFKSANGKKYAFRLLDKQPEKSLNDILQNSVYKGITQELITTMHPYAPLVAHELMEATDIIHIKPELFILDRNDGLSEKYNSYIGKIGTLEEKPKGSSKKHEGFYGADAVVTSYEMLIDLRKSHTSKMDKYAYAKARLMDMFIGDWDRHEDNWKWAMFKEDGHHIYRPIPKDRDHTFSHWTGLIPSIADVFVMNAEDFDYKFGNLRQLNFKARFLDRQLALELDLSSWMEAVHYLQSKMTDEVIDNAITQFPEEIRDMHGHIIAAKLKSRRDDLPRAMEAYYAELNSEVQVRASNKKDHVKLVRLGNGDAQVNFYHIKKDDSLGDSYYQRIFEYGIVKSILLFGLDGDDVFEIAGNVDRTIQVKIIGGNGKDQILDNSNVRYGGKSITVFDSFKEDEIEESINVRVKSPRHVAHYDPYKFDFNWLLPSASIRQSSGNGWGFGLGASYMTRGFNKEGFVNKYDIKGLYYPGISAYRLDGKYTRKQVIGLSDLFVSSRFTTLYDKFPFFYGIGNDTKLIREERGVLNRIDYKYVDVNVGLQREFYTKSSWTNFIGLEYHQVMNHKDFEVISSKLAGYGIQTFAGANSILKLDFTDRSFYPLDGSQLHVELKTRSSFDGDVSGNIDTKFTHYKTIDLGIKFTIAGSIRYNQAIGRTNFYHMSKIGSQTNFRGYTRNRFIDKYALLSNAEVRMNLGYVQTPLIRFYIGLFGFYDSGKVWSQRSYFLNNNWNNSYGGGFFISPGWEQFAITFTIGKQDDDYTYSKIQLGFDF